LSRRHLAWLPLCASLAGLIPGCASRAPADWAVVREVTPAYLVPLAATDAALASDRHGRVALTWVTRDSLGQDLWLALSSDSGLTFSAPVRVNPRRGSVSSTAESRPIPAFGPAGQFVVAWSDRRGDSLLIADLVVRGSGDGGRTLGPPVIVNDDAADGQPVFHGFPSLAALPGGDWFAVWIDFREPAANGRDAASLFYAVSGDGGQTWSDNRSLTALACPCCRVTAVADSSGHIAVAYRSAADRLRDPALAVSHDRGATFALDIVLAPDRWLLAGCPVEGPTLTTDHAGGGHYAWYTGAGGGGTWLARWRADGGTAGVKRPLDDALVGARHPRLARLGVATIITVEGRTRDDASRGVVAVRELDGGGDLTPWLLLGADADHAWIAPAGERAALLCWTEHEEDRDRVRVARVTPRR